MKGRSKRLAGRGERGGGGGEGARLRMLREGHRALTPERWQREEGELRVETGKTAPTQ